MSTGSVKIPKANLDSKSTFRKQFYRFALPSALGMLVNSLYVVADGIFIARGIGTEAIAAINVGYPVINLLAAMGLMFGVGGATFVALNPDDQIKKNRIFTYTLLLNLVVYSVISGIVFLFPDQIMYAFGATDRLLPLVKDYLYPCLLAAFFLMISFSLNAFVRNDNAPKKAMYSLIIGAVTNVILDYIFIFKLHMGIEGGAFATAIAQVVSALYLASHFFNSSFKLDLKIKQIDWDSIYKISSLGFSSFILEAAVMVITVLVNLALIKSEGETGVAAFGIIAYIFVIPRMFFIGLAQGIQPLVSNYFGQKEYKSVIEVYRFGQKVALTLTLVVLLLTFLYAEYIVSVFTGEEAIIPYTANGLFLYTSAVVFVGANFMNISYLQAMNRANLANTISICRGIVFMAISISVLPKFWGVNGIWLALPLADVLTFLLTITLFKALKINDKLVQPIVEAASIHIPQTDLEPIQIPRPSRAS
ncbi:MATE family efflux transporter [Sediminitomix flava]|uniref:Multidrug export protein MepA n=1 Tax=Sediminitomix flava TaxID=379075 RepID=A0A316A495_SEDFL|nr:MATE family efflux transporter [Sediminitomix flava]PWJ44557.1 putative MATE family efflux protein [Sediminitomix flava]